MFLPKVLITFSFVSSLLLCSYLFLNDSYHSGLLVAIRDFLIIIIFYMFNKYDLKCDDKLKYICKNKWGAGYFAAESYFYGYLNKVLPVSEIKNHSEIAERIEDYENIQKICIPIKKLLVLLPLSGETEPQIGKHVKDIIKSRQNLNNLSLDRAGVKNREFSHTVYEVKVDNSSVNMVAEYATPLKTILEVSAGSPESPKYTRIIIESFYSRLMELLNGKPDCKKFIEIIIYDDKTVDDGALQLQKFVKAKKDKGELICDCPYSIQKRKEELNETERSLENDQDSSLPEDFDYLRRRTLL